MWSAAHAAVGSLDAREPGGQRKGIHPTEKLGNNSNWIHGDEGDGSVEGIMAFLGGLTILAVLHEPFLGQQEGSAGQLALVQAPLLLCSIHFQLASPWFRAGEAGMTLTWPAVPQRSAWADLPAAGDISTQPCCACFAW